MQYVEEGIRWPVEVPLFEEDEIEEALLSARVYYELIESVFADPVAFTIVNYMLRFSWMMEEFPPKDEDGNYLSPKKEWVMAWEKMVRKLGYTCDEWEYR